VSAPSDLHTLVLHGLRLKGFAEADAVAEAASIPHDATAEALERLVDEGLASRRDGRLAGYTLTAAGRARHAALLAEELDRTGVRDAVQETYRRFLGLNHRLLTICTEWQLRDVDGTSTLNDHSDPGYDAAVIRQLAVLHGEAAPIFEALAASLARYAPYAPRFAHAVERVLAGDIDWFTKPMIPSYHTVWFELHEDLLATLGIERGSEVPA
jgi:hypothetical protein